MGRYSSRRPIPENDYAGILHKPPHMHQFVIHSSGLADRGWLLFGLLPVAAVIQLVTLETLRRFGRRLWTNLVLSAKSNTNSEHFSHHLETRTSHLLMKATCTRIHPLHRSLHLECRLRWCPTLCVKMRLSTLILSMVSVIGMVAGKLVGGV